MYNTEQQQQRRNGVTPSGRHTHPSRLEVSISSRFDRFFRNTFAGNLQPSSQSRAASRDLEKGTVSVWRGPTVTKAQSPSRTEALSSYFYRNVRSRFFSQASTPGSCAEVKANVAQGRSRISVRERSGWLTSELSGTAGGRVVYYSQGYLETFL